MSAPDKYRTWPECVSVSQIEKFDACERQWWFDKIAKVPREEKDYFDFGSALHAAIERYLNGGEPFPEGWADGFALTIPQKKDVQELFELGLKDGLLPPAPYGDDAGIEWEFPDIPFGEGLPNLRGYVDVALGDRAEVQDHKTAKRWRYARSEKELAKDRQMLSYAKALLLAYAANGMGVPETVNLRHNVYLKWDQYNGKDREKGRTRRTETRVGIDAVEKNWDEMTEIVRRMVEVGKREDWTEIPEPADMPDPCNAYGGCPHRPVCFMMRTLDSHKRIMAGVPAETAPTTPEGDGTMSKLDELKRKKAGGATAAPPAPDETPAEPAKAEAPPAGGPAPWAQEDCKGCGGSGWSTSKKPCRPCAARAEDAGQPTPDQFDISVQNGVPTATPKGEDPINSPLPDEAKAKAETPAETPAEKGVAAPEGKPSDGKPPAKRKTGGRKKKEKAQDKAPDNRGTFLLFVDCEPTRAPADAEIVRLNDMLLRGPFGEHVAKQLKAKTYLDCNPFDRRDAVGYNAKEFSAWLDGKMLVVNTGATEEREVWANFVPFAGLVVRGF